MRQHRDHLVGELVRVGANGAVIVDGIGMIHGLEQLDVETVDRPAVDAEHVLDRVPIGHVVELSLPDPRGQYVVHSP